MPESRTIGPVLRGLREERGELLREVASDPRLDIDPTLLSHIENGRRVPTPPQLEGLAAHFGLPMEELMPYVDRSLNARARTSWGRRSRSESAVRQSPGAPPAAAPPGARFAAVGPGPSWEESAEFGALDALRCPGPDEAPMRAETLTDALGPVTSSADAAIDGLAEMAAAAVERLRDLAGDSSAPAQMRRRARSALDWLSRSDGR